MTNQRIALVVGNEGYRDARSLINAINDANDVTAALERFGFTVIKRTNCAYRDMDVALMDFRGALYDGAVGLFFFAGHGMQIDGSNYLAAVDTNFSCEVDAKHSSMPLDRIIETMERAATDTNIVILDACRDNPFKNAWHRSSAARGLAPVYAPRGMMIAYATSPGQTAADGTGRNGAYTTALLQHIGTPDCTIETMFKRVRNTLSASTSKKQISWEHTSLSGEFFFNLSIGVRIDCYSREALADGLFVFDRSRDGHQLIQDLKSLTWPVQNPAADAFVSAGANTYPDDVLFVIGRNMYQAACGRSRSSANFLRDFPARTSGMDPQKRKALLDGALFEAYFDSKGCIRPKPKEWYGNDILVLQQYPALSPSFAFISECLLPYADRFFAVPGKNHVIAVDVVARLNNDGRYLLESVFLSGTNILWVEEDPPSPFSQQFSGPVRQVMASIGAFENWLSVEMHVPRHLLTVAYSFDSSRVQALHYEAGSTVRKRAQ